jgi:hypothetical protein
MKTGELLITIPAERVARLMIVARAANDLLPREGEWWKQPIDDEEQALGLALALEGLRGRFDQDYDWALKVFSGDAVRELLEPPA